MRAVDGLCLVAAVATAAYVFNVKHEAEIAQDTRAALERDIATVSRDVRLLEADLAALEEPARIQRVIASLPETFALEPITSAHYIHLDDIPFRTDLIVEAPENAGEISDDDLGVPVAVGLAVPSALDVLLQEVAGNNAPTIRVDPVSSGDGIGALLEAASQGDEP